MFSLKEVLDDILAFEGMSVRIEQANSTTQFKQLYSQYYIEPAGNNLPVDKFYSKIENYVSENLIEEK